MDKVKILIVEDEAIIADDLQGLLENIGYQVTNIALSVKQALTHLSQTLPDIVLIDIVLKGESDGIDLANYIREHYQLPFVFITSHIDKATLERAKATQPNGYLVKPFQAQDVYVAVEIALSNHAQHSKTGVGQGLVSPENLGLVLQDSFFIRNKGMLSKIKFDHIDWLQADANYTFLHTQQRKYIVRNNLKEVERKLPAHQFLRIHKSYVVNLESITALSAQKVQIGETEIPVGRSYYAQLLQRINLLNDG